MKKIFYISITLSSLVFAMTQQNDRNGRGGERTPPQEAIDICESKSEGDTCSMTTRRGDSVQGTCENTPDNKYFACKPPRRSRN